MGEEMRKIATLALASALSIAALAPAAFANNPNCNGVKEFAPIMKEIAKDKTIKGNEKITEAYDLCKAEDRVCTKVFMGPLVCTGG